MPTLHGNQDTEIIISKSNLTILCNEYKSAELFKSEVLKSVKGSLFIYSLFLTFVFNNVKTLENIYDKMVSLCFKLNLQYTGNRNINADQLFKDRLHLVESGKTS